ncbi:hypothetical protein MRX96_003203 [Rhipicephalus microplus]
MAICTVVGCSNSSKNISKYFATTTLFRVQKIAEWHGTHTKALTAKRRRLWLARVKQADQMRGLSNIRVCGAHFVTGRPAKLHQETNPDWALTLLLGYARKAESIACYEHAARRRFEQTTTEVDAADRGGGQKLPLPVAHYELPQTPVEEPSDSPLALRRQSQRTRKEPDRYVPHDFRH